MASAVKILGFVLLGYIIAVIGLFTYVMFQPCCPTYKPEATIFNFMWQCMHLYKCEFKNCTIQYDLNEDGVEENYSFIDFCKIYKYNLTECLEKVGCENITKDKMNKLESMWNTSTKTN